jgi:hypothetical protein
MPLGSVAYDVERNDEAAVGKNTHIRPDGCGAINTVKVTGSTIMGNAHVFQQNARLRGVRDGDWGEFLGIRACRVRRIVADRSKATRWIWICLLLLFLAVFALSSTAEETTNVVDLKLVIAVDVSTSMDQEEQRLQRGSRTA